MEPIQITHNGETYTQTGDVITGNEPFSKIVDKYLKQGRSVLLMPFADGYNENGEVIVKKEIYQSEQH
jgi:hypothetical protein